MGSIDNKTFLHFPRVDSSAKVLVDASSAASERSMTVANPDGFELTVGEGCVQLVIVRDNSQEESHVKLNIAPQACLEVVEVSIDGGKAYSEIEIEQEGRCRITSVVVGNSCTRHMAKLVGIHGNMEFGSVFIAGDGERASVDLRVEHTVADCTSNSLIKGVAAGSGEGRFDGMVYVAPDAQRTDARQTSRNVTIGGEARIKALPQLEIYADDVKCSHGATVGQMDSDAILYMRQRGLSEQSARRMQIEGFVADVLSSCGIDYMKDFLLGMLSRKMDDLL